MPKEKRDIKLASLDRIEIVDENLRGGFAQVPRYILRAQGLSVKAKLVYIALLDYAWQQGSCFPGQPRLASDLDVSIDTVQRALAELRSVELVDWTQRGLNQTNVYFILRLSDNPYWEPDQEGNRKLRFPDTANSGFKKPQKRGTKNTQTEHTQNQYTQDSNNFELLTQKSKNGTTFRKSKRRDKIDQTVSQQIAEPRPQHRTSGGMKGIGELLEHHTPSDAAANGTQQPSQSRKRGRPPKYPATPGIESMMEQWTDELHDSPEHVRSNVSQAARLWHESGVSEDTFRSLLYEARQRTKQAGNVEKMAEGAVGELGFRNRMPYFFACLKTVIREDLQRPVNDRAPNDGQAKSSRTKRNRTTSVSLGT